MDVLNDVIFNSMIFTIPAGLVSLIIGKQLGWSVIHHYPIRYLMALAIIWILYAFAKITGPHLGTNPNILIMAFISVPLWAWSQLSWAMGATIANLWMTQIFGMIY